MADTQSFDQAVQGVLNKAQASAGAGGLSWSLFGQLYEQLKIAAIEAAKDLAVAGIQKKQYVIDALGVFIDNYLPLPSWLFFLRPTIKKYLLWLAAGAIEALYERLVKTLPATPTPAPTP
jgi:hypothetical protein